MKILESINFAIAIIFSVCYFYQYFYMVYMLFKKNKAHAGDVVEHKFAVMICARNEERVIGGLLKSLKSQSYNQDNISVFVMADNCTDNTAKVSRECGAYVYERQNKELVGKGYALEELLKHIEKDFGAFDGYFVFDADNILEPDYIEQMNRSFCDGYDILTSYRNSKNYGGNWVSAGYALWFLRESKYLNQARWNLGTSCAVSGTGFMFSRRIFEKIVTWKYHLLTEDIEFTVDQVIDGEIIGFCPDAVLYDEQPISFKQSWRQRMRWSKGYIQVFVNYGKKLILGMLKGSLGCYDMAMNIMPAFVLSFAAIICNVSVAILGAMRGDDMMILVKSLGTMIFNAYIILFIIGAVTTVSEWKKIHTSTFKKILYAFTFPLFMFTYVPISITALFAKVTWKPIEHGLSNAGMTVNVGFCANSRDNK